LLVKIYDNFVVLLIAQSNALLLFVFPTQFQTLIYANWFNLKTPEFTSVMTI